jgi:hypothetical protein
MAHRRSTPKQQKTFAANAAFLLTAAILSAPAFAATTSSIPCADVSEATLEVSASALVAVRVNHDVPANSDTPVDDIETVSSASLLAPRAEAAIRDAFKESVRVSSDSEEPMFRNSALAQPMVGAGSKPHTVINSNTGTAPAREMNTKLPGVSDVASSRYKKQMFRRDI